MMRMMIAFCLVVSVLLAALPHLLWLVCSTMSKPMGYSCRYTPFGWAAVVLVMLFFLLMGYGYFFGRWQRQLRSIEYQNNSIPSAFSGFKIMHISDLHLGSFSGHEEQLEQTIRAINAAQPDIVCFTGDLCTIDCREAAPFTAILKGIQAPVYAVLGNHDFFIYSRELTEQQRQQEVDKLCHYITDSLGWHLLRNEHQVLTAADGSSITLLGVDNTRGAEQGFRTIDCGNLQQAMADTDGFRILLTHDPSHWEAEVLPTTDIPLTLAGHTHASQVRIFGWNPAQLMFRQSDGRYEYNGQTLNVNIGIGCTAPFRIGTPQDLTLITLRN